MPVQEIETPMSNLSDLEKLRRLLDEFGVGYQCHLGHTLSGETTVTCEAKLHAKVRGYTGFRAEFSFRDGSFDSMWVWE